MHIFADETVHLALDPRGAGYVAWSSSKRSSTLRVHLATADPRGRPLRSRTLSPRGVSAAVLALATSRRSGEALVLWNHAADAYTSGHGVFAGLLTPRGAYTGEQTISASTRAGRPAAAFDPISGAATVVWPEATGPEGDRVPVSKLRSVLHSASRLPDAAEAS